MTELKNNVVYSEFYLTDFSTDESNEGQPFRFKELNALDTRTFCIEAASVRGQLKCYMQDDHDKVLSSQAGFDSPSNAVSGTFALVEQKIVMVKEYKAQTID